jgi:L-malate glycosyltransferase
MAEVARQLSERLVKRGHKVTVATGAHAARGGSEQNGVKVMGFAISGNAVMGYQGDTAAYEKFLLDGNYDIVTCFAAQQWATDLALPLLDKIKGKKVFVPTGFSYLHNPAYRGYYEEMKSRMKQFDANVFLSSDYRDVQFARDHGITRNYLIPNAAAEEEFDKPLAADLRAALGIKPGAFLVLHVGSFTGAKGQPEAIRIFLKANVVNSVLLLSGHNNAALGKLLNSHPRFIWKKWLSWLKGKKIIVAELDRTQTVDAYKSADLFLFPSNVECSPIVLFECMAAGLPFLSSDAGNAAEIAEWGGNGLILPTEKDQLHWSHVRLAESARILRHLAQDPARLKLMSQNGRRAFKNRFTWNKIALQYEELYLSL